MSQPSHFRQVIQRVIERSPRGLAAADLAEKIVEGLDLAEAILGDGPVQLHQPSGQMRPNPSHGPSPGLILAATPAYRDLDLSQGLMIATEDSVFDTRTASFGDGLTKNTATIIEEAPPNAYVRNPDAPILQESPEETERKKAELHGLILRSLPASMKLRLPNLPHDLDLKLAVLPSPAGMNFVRIRYGQHQGEEDAPQVQVSTQDTGFDPDSIKGEIVKQAEARYRAARPALIPRIIPSAGFPDTDLFGATKQNTPTSTDEVVPRADVEAWEKSVGRKIG